MFARIDLGQRKEHLLHHPSPSSPIAPSSIKSNSFSLDDRSNNNSNLCPSSIRHTGSVQPHWDIFLDRDLLETIVNFYPEWFMEEEPSTSSTNGEAEPQSLGSPRVVVDEGSLQKAMVKNKESLKVKLLLRRPISQLVEQGILPPLKTSPNFYEQSKKLERARMEDFLKHKIQHRPDRQSLIEQHILEDTTVSPSLQDKQRQLKRARLTDGLNDRLSHRPGPLELVKGNILIAEEGLAQAIKEGALQFKATSEGEPVKHPPPLFHLEDPESSISSSDGSPPQDLSDASVTSYSPLSVPGAVTTVATVVSAASTSGPPATSVTSVPAAAAGPAAVAASLVLTATTVTSLSSPHSTQFVQSTQPICLDTSNLCTGQSAPSGPVATTATATASAAARVVGQQIAGSASNSTPSFVLATSNPDSAVAKPTFTPQTTILNTATSTAVTATASNTTSNKTESINKARKKSKSKVQPKTRTIKFHEYKGPPNAQKSQNNPSNSSAESSYELLLKQQQLFLQWQLEWQQKYPHHLPPAQKPVQHLQDQSTGSNSLSSPSQQQQQQQQQHQHQQQQQQPPQQQSQSTSNVVTNSPLAKVQTGEIHVSAKQNIQSAVQNSNSPCNNKNQSNSGTASTSQITTNPKLISKLEDLKVSDLKVHLKKRSLPVSGSKPLLIERLKPFAEEVLASVRANEHSKVSTHVLQKPLQSSKAPRSNSSPSFSSVEGQADSPANSLQSKINITQAIEVPMETNEMAIDPSDFAVSARRASDASTLRPTATVVNGTFVVNEVPSVANGLKAVQSQQQQQPQAQPQPQQIQLHLPYVFSSQGHSISIPLASLTTASPFQLIASPAQKPPPHQTSAPSQQQQQQQQQQSQQQQQQPQPQPQPQSQLQSQSQISATQVHRTSHPTIVQESACEVRPSSASVKANLAAFLQSQAHLQSQGATATVSPMITAQLLQSDPSKETLSFPQVVVYQEPQQLEPNKHQHQHQLQHQHQNQQRPQQHQNHHHQQQQQQQQAQASPQPHPQNDACNGLASSSQSVISHLNDSNSTADAMSGVFCQISSSTGTESLLDPRPPPPKYEDVVKERPKGATRKVISDAKSQALDDVIDVLKNEGEVSLFHQQTNSLQQLSHHQQQEKNSGLVSSQLGMQLKSSTTNVNRSSVAGTNVRDEAKQTRNSCSSNNSSIHTSEMALELDSFLDLPTFDDPMDLNVTCQDQRNLSNYTWNSGTNVSSNGTQGNTVKVNSNERRYSSSDQTCDLSLSWMDISPDNVSDWLSEFVLGNGATTSDNGQLGQSFNYSFTAANGNVVNNNNTIGSKLDRKSREVPNSESNSPSSGDVMKNHLDHQQSSSTHHRASFCVPNQQMPCSTYTSKDRDPLLPNNMLGTTSASQPLQDLYFDVNEIKSHEQDLSFWCDLPT